MSNLNSKRFIGCCVWTVLLFFLAGYGAIHGFPAESSQFIWGYISTVLTPLTGLLWGAYMGVDTYQHIKEIRG